MAELLHRHLVLIKRKAELSLVINIALPLNIKRLCALRLKLARDLLGRVVELFEEGGGNGEVVAACKLGDLALVPEGGTHDDCGVAEFLVVVVDALHARDAGVGGGVVGLACCGLVPVQDAAYEGGNEEGAGFGGRDGLLEREHESEVGVDAVHGLELASGLDAFPGGRDFDEDAVFGDADGFVELEES